MSLNLIIGNREEFNCTYNAGIIWYKIFPDDEGMVYIDGMIGEEAKKKLAFARYKMVEHARELIKLEPSNGWGTLNGFIEFIEQLIQACERHPKSVWRSER